MPWSQLKKRAEAFLCTPLHKRLAFHNTAYQRTHDHTGRCWVTLDKHEIFQASTVTWLVKYYDLAQQIRQNNQCLSYTDPQQKEGYYHAYTEAEQILNHQGVYTQWQFLAALEEWTNLAIDQALGSDNALIRALALLDRRLGKRRLHQIRLTEEEHPLIRMFFDIRWEAESGATEHSAPLP